MTPIDQLKSVLCDSEGKCCITGSDEDRAIIDRALQALTQSQQQAEPVGEVVEVNNDGFKCEFNQRLAVGAKLYTTPPAAQQAEPLEYWNAVEGWVKIDELREHFNTVNCGTIYKHAGEGRVPLYTAPAQRPWVGLTEDEKFEMAAAQYGWEDLLIAAEARLKEKNNV